MTPLRFGLYVLGFAIIAALAVSLARAGNTPMQSHDVIFIASEQVWNDVDDPGRIYSCTRSLGAVPCPLGENSAQAVADLLSAGYTVQPALQMLNPYGVVFSK